MTCPIAMMLIAQAVLIYNLQEYVQQTYLALLPSVLIALTMAYLLLRKTQVEIVSDKVEKTITFKSTIQMGCEYEKIMSLDDLVDMRVKVVQGRGLNCCRYGLHALVYIFKGQGGSGTEQESNIQVQFMDGVNDDYQQHLQQLNEFHFHSKIRQSAAYKHSNMKPLISAFDTGKIYTMILVLNSTYVLSLYFLFQSLQDKQ